jgi:hypothetical protein
MPLQPIPRLRSQTRNLSKIFGPEPNFFSQGGFIQSGDVNNKALKAAVMRGMTPAGF